MIARIFLIQCFRLKPGDCNTRDAPTVGEDLQSAEKSAKERLLSYFNDNNIPPHKRPHHANLVDVDGTIVARLRATSSTTVERVPI